MKISLCRKCGEDSLTEEKMPDDHIHFSKVICNLCGFFYWGKKPQNNNKRPAQKRLRNNVNYCEICLKDKKHINDWLEEHHILPYSTHPKLDKIPGNRLVVCRQCHTIIHCLRKLV